MRTVRLALLVFGLGISAAAQNSSQSQPQPQPQPDTTPAPAFGQNTPVLNPENPPVSGLDEPGLELHTASRSFFSPALQVSESGDSNASNQFGSTGAESITRVLGAFDLQQFWPKSDLYLEYLGGGAFYGNPFEAQQLQAAGLEAVTRWRTGQATLRDAFNYLPDGSFQIGTFGGLPGFGLATGSFGTGAQGGGLPGTSSFSSGQFGSVGNIPRLANTAILDAIQAINPVSAITAAGGFSNAHFYDSGCSNPLNTCLIDSDQVTVQGGYSHLLSRHDQIGAVFAFQLFQFPASAGGEIYNDIINIRWSHTISGKLSLIAGAGPQYTHLENGAPLQVRRWSVSGRVQLRYKMGHASLVATYEKFTSSGSGFFAGADTQAARLAYTRPLGRTWEFYGDLGYSNNQRLQVAGPGALGVDAASYNEGSAGAVIRKHLGRSYDFFAGYRFSDVDFPVVVCPVGGGCGTTAQRHIGSVGVEWHPTPTRIE
ncbi:MAG: hypothetical protein ABSA27_19700 [Terriglobales bacterium]|jgi:hypothetical protein